MWFFSREIGRRKSISQMALLVQCLPEDDTGSAARVCEEYFKTRRWRFGKSDAVLFQRQLTGHRKRGVRKGLKKCLRTSKRCLRIKAGKHVAVFNRDFSQGAEPFDFVEQMDRLMDKGQILKNGRTSYVSRLSWNGRDVVVKRYNHKGFVHSLRHTIKRSRARRGWLHGHRLGMLEIPTPKPLAFVERRKGPLLWKSYLVTEYVQGQKLYDFLHNGISQEQRSKVVEQIKELLGRLGKYRITHGDLKHSNILLTEAGPVLTDLDGMKVHRWGWTFGIKQQKDMERFSKRFSQPFVRGSF